MRGISIIDLWVQPSRRGVGLRWMARVRDPVAKRYGPARSFAKKEDAEEWGRGELAAYQKGNKRAHSADWGDVGAAYVKQAKLAKLQPRYIKQLQQVVDELTAAGARSILANDFADVVQQWLASRCPTIGGKKAEAGSTTPGQQKALLTIARQIVNSIIPKVVAYSPLADIKLAKPPKRQGRYFKIHELRQLIDPMNRRHAKRGLRETRTGDWWLFAVLGLYTYQRPTIVRNLQLEWFDFTTNHLHVPPDCPGNKARVPINVPIQPELKEILLEEILAGRVRRNSEPIVGKIINEMAESNLSRCFGLFCDRCGVTKLGTHRLRHSAASLLVATGLSGFVVMDYLGQSRPEVTKHYALGARFYLEEAPDIATWRGVFRLRNQSSKSEELTKTPALPPR